MHHLSPSQLASTTASFLSSMDRSIEASKWIERAYHLDPTNPVAIIAKGSQLLAMNDFAGVVGLVNQSECLGVSDFRFLAWRRDIALFLYRSDFWEYAARWLQAAAELEPWDKPLLDAAKRTSLPEYYSPTIHDFTTGKVLERYAAREGDTYIYVIEIVGTCNLRCPTCPVGNSPREGRAVGMIKPDVFRKIVDKIKRESPVASPQINLFNWGEPLLHPALPSFIRVLQDAGFRSHLSSNLNIKRGLEEVIQACPDDFKISLSGFTPETYSRFHAQGDLDLVKKNMRKLSELRNLHQSSTNIWVGHHVYKSNRHEVDEVRKFCDELGFAYYPVEAFYMPLERILELLQGESSPVDEGIISELLTDPVERAQRSSQTRRGRFDCELRFNQTVINHDGSVALCCTVYDAENMLGVNFLDASFDQLETLKYKHDCCQKCFANSLQYSPHELNIEPHTKV